MSSHTRILRREYTGEILTNLKITDNCVKTSLLAKFSPKVPTTVLPKLREFNNGQFLLELSNVLSSKECAEIIKNADKCIFEDISDKYRFGKQRNSSRLLALDETLTGNLWKSINEVLLKEMENQGVSMQPLGFDVTRGVWDLHGLNEAIRINKYSGETEGYFGPHKDAQFCPNGDERSIMTLIIYLNDDFQGGETCFYFPNDSTLSSKGMMIKEEIDLHGGLKKGYKRAKIVPKVGHAVLSSQNILHEALAVRNGTKYILKTDVVVKRCSKEFGFAVEDREKKDFLTCLNYFREAQQREVHRIYDVASDLYEKALSIRYCYPGSLGETPKAIDTSGYTRLPSEVWLHVMKFLSGHDAQNLVYAYPALNVVQAIWEQRQRNTAPILLSEKFLPKIRYQKGVLTSFEFPDADFFRENKAECCRVAAMYSFFLLGHSPRDDVYTVRYNPETQEVCVVALETLLADVFYGRRCYGSVYNIRQQDPERRDPKKDFEASVDRDYMLIKHGAEFTGVELPDSFYTKSTVYISSDDDDSDDGGDDDDSDRDSDDDYDGVDHMPARKEKGVYHDNRIPFYGEIDQNFSINQIILHMQMSADRESADVGVSETDTCELEKVLNDPVYMDSIENYFRVFEKPINGPSVALVSNLKAPISFDRGEVCICFMGPNAETADRMAMNCSTEYFNHLIFNFQESQLNVRLMQDHFNENDSFYFAEDFYADAVMWDIAELGCTGELITSEVNIEPVLSSDTSFNHAACQCGHPRFEVGEYCNLKQYLHLTSVRLYAKEQDGKMIVWTSYNGIVAL